MDSEGVVRASGNLEVFSKKARETEKSAGGAEKGVASLDGVFSQLNLSSIAAGAGIATLYKALTGIAGAVKDFGAQSVQTYAHFEGIQNSLSGLTGSAEKGKALFEDLRKFSFDTTFGVDTLAQASTTLMQTGTSVVELKTRLKQLGDIAGGDTEKFNRLTEVFAKIQNMGKTNGQLMQSLQLLGVPITQELQKMGIAGQATSEQVVEAFQRMTAEGGIFHDNMESINATISGKEGFVSDTWRELLASFAEASGLADVYKSALDLVYNALQGIVDGLQKINENPVYRALFQGVLVAGAVALTTALGGGLLVALGKVIVKLATIAALKTVIDPVKTAAGLAVAAGVAAGAAVAINQVVKSRTEEARQLTDLQGKLEQYKAEYAALRAIGADTTYIDGLIAKTEQEIKAVKELHNIVSEFDNAAMVESYTHQLDEVNKKLLERAAIIKKEFDKWNIGMTFEEFSADDDILKSLKEQQRVLQAQLEITQEALSYEEMRNQVAKEYDDMLKARQETYENMLTDIDKAFEKTDKGQEEKLKAEIEKYKGYLAQFESRGWKGADGNLAFNAETAENIRKVKIVIDSLTASMTKADKKAVASAKTWRDAFTEITGSVVNDANKGIFAANGRQAADFYLEGVKKELGNDKEIARLLGKTFDLSGSYADIANSLQSTIGRLLTDDTFRGTFDDNSIKALVEAAKEFQSLSFDEQIDALRDEYDLLKLQTEEMEKQKLIREGMTPEQADEIIRVKKDIDIYQGAKDDVESKQSAYDAIPDGVFDSLEKAQARLALATAKETLAKLNLADANKVLKNAQADYDFALADTVARQLEYEAALAEADEIIRTFGENSREAAAALQNVANAKTNSDNAGVAVQRAQSNLESAQGTKDSAQGAADNAAAEKEAAKTEETQAQFTDAIMGSVSGLGELGSTVGSVVNSLMAGAGPLGIILSLIGQIIGALDGLFSQVEGFDQLKNFISYIFSKLEPLKTSLSHVINPLLSIFSLIGSILNLLITLGKPLAFIAEVITLLFGKLAQVLEKLIGKLTSKLNKYFDKFDQWYDKLADRMGMEDKIEHEKEDELATLQALRQQYNSLLKTIKEQEDYYLTAKRHANAETYNERAMGVHDMILTPQGRFSTDPDDYIIATKNPGALGGGGSGAVKLTVKIENTISNVAQVQTSTQTGEDGNEELVVQVIQRTADAIANGDYGFDGALERQRTRTAGTYISS